MVKKLTTFLLLTFFALVANAAAKTVTLATTTWEPYVRNAAVDKGYLYSIVEDSFKAAGYQVTIKFMPWHEAVAELKKGTIDGLFPEYYSAERAQDMVFSQPFSGGPIVLYKRRDAKVRFPNENPTENLVETFKQMENYTFGVVKDYANVPAFDDNRRLHKIEVMDDKANLEQLYEGKVQVAVVDKYVAEYLINHQLPKDYSSKLTFMPPILGYKLLYLGVARKNPHHEEILSAFNRGLKIIKKNGKITEILDHDAQMTGSQLG